MDNFTAIISETLLVEKEIFKPASKAEIPQRKRVADAEYEKTLATPVTAEEVARWVGSTSFFATEVIRDVANGRYTIETLKRDIKKYSYGM